MRAIRSRLIRRCRCAHRFYDSYIRSSQGPAASECRCRLGRSFGSSAEWHLLSAVAAVAPPRLIRPAHFAAPVKVLVISQFPARMKTTQRRQWHPHLEAALEAALEVALRHPRRHRRRIVLKRDIFFFEGLAILIKNACVCVTDLL
jgi:hypothetical protein